MLMEEFARAGIELDMDRRRTIDVQRIFYKMEPRTLKAALKFYCDKDHGDAHDALADVRATIDVFFGQLERYRDIDYTDEQGAVLPNPVRPEVQALHAFTNDQRYADATQKLRYDMDGVVVFNFGKYNGHPVAATLANDRQYYHWILNKEFSTQVKQLVKQLVRDHEKAQQNEQG